MGEQEKEKKLLRYGFMNGMTQLFWIAFTGLQNTRAREPSNVSLAVAVFPFMAFLKL
jgi:hypothetical protein